MTPALVLTLDVVAAAVLAVWVVVRFPDVGPRSLPAAIVFFLAGQCVPSLGIPVLTPVLRFPYGIELALLAVVLPAFFAMFLTLAWLVRAASSSVGGGGHRVRGRDLARSRG